MKHMTIEDYYSLSLNEINNITNPTLKKEILVLYNEEIKKLEQDPIGKWFIDSTKSIEEIAYDIEQYTESITSEYLFDGNIVKFYPSIKSSIATKPIICHFSGGVIYTGSAYYSYRPLLQNINTNQRYVLNTTIKVEESYIDYLPRTLKEFERFIYNLDYAYSLNNNDKLDYYSISCNLKDWSLLELNKKQKIKVLK